MCNGEERERKGREGRIIFRIGFRVRIAVARLNAVRYVSVKFVRAVMIAVPI